MTIMILIGNPMTDHDPDCATQFSGENSTTHPRTCKNPNPMKIVAIEQEIRDAETLADKICREELGQEPSKENEAFRKTLVHGMVRWIESTRYLATHSKQG